MSNAGNLTGEPGILHKSEFQVDDIDIPFATMVRPETDKLVIFYNGAVNRSISPDGKCFQRSTWIDHFDFNCLFIADPTIVRRNDLRLGWGQINSDTFCGELYPKVINEIGEHLGIAPDKRLHYGSSGGGFQALVSSAADKGSRALVNNPQTDWLLYDSPNSINSVLQNELKSKPVDAWLSSQPWRFRVWDWFSRVENIPNFRLLLNTASPNDRDEHVPALIQGLNKLHSRFPEAMWEIVSYHDSVSKHNPADQRMTLEELRNSVSAL